MAEKRLIETPEQLRGRAKKLYRAPFKWLHGYIYDADGEMVADDRPEEPERSDGALLRVRGWGRIGYLPNNEALHDEVGRLLAEALSKAWGDL